MKTVKKYAVLFVTLGTMHPLSADPDMKRFIDGREKQQSKVDRVGAEIIREEVEQQKFSKKYKLSKFARELRTKEPGSVEEAEFLERFSDTVLGGSMELTVSKAEVEFFSTFFIDVKNTVNKNYRKLGSVNVRIPRPSDGQINDTYFSWESGEKIGEIILKLR